MSAQPPLAPTAFSDSALSPDRALEDDELDRLGYAQAVVAALNRVSAQDGLVIAVEGSWGCGKTSCLSMIEALLARQEVNRPVVVHFNPWLVGDRDQLLDQFLNALVLALGRSDAANELSSVSRALENYSGTLEFVGLIPGAEPWASIVKGVVRAASKATGGIAEQKKKSIEDRKNELDLALREAQRRIIVFVDDIDRLYPTEAYEMVRIIKAVGSLPNVGFVVAWDPDYVAQALTAAHVPSAKDYLRKVVQIPLPVPPLTERQKLQRIQQAINSLGEDATKEHFPGASDRLSRLYYSALRKLIDTPRDINRLFNAVSVTEKGLREEIVLADIIGLACVNQFAPSIFIELHRDPRLFLEGSIGFEIDESKQRKKIESRWSRLLVGVGNRRGVEALILHLFPNFAKALGKYATHAPNLGQGHIADAGRLKVALSMQAGTRDASISQARRYLTEPKRRQAIEQALNADNAQDFLSMLEDVADGLAPHELGNVGELAKDIARLADLPQVKTALDTDGSGFRTGDSCLAALVKISSKFEGDEPIQMARAVLEEPAALTVASEILRSANDKQSRPGFDDLVGFGAPLGEAPVTFANNAILAVKQGLLWSLPNPARVLRSLSYHVPNKGAEMLEALLQDDPSLDKFATAFLYYSFSNPGGRAYCLPEDDGAWNIITKDALIQKAKERLADPALTGHTMVAWRSAVEGKKLMGNTGESARH